MTTTPEDENSAAARRARQKTFRTAMLMVILPLLGVGLASFLYISPSVREAYYRMRWQQATKPKDKIAHFAGLMSVQLAPAVREKYLLLRFEELVKVKEWETINRMIAANWPKDRLYWRYVIPAVQREGVELLAQPSVAQVKFEPEKILLSATFLPMTKKDCPALVAALKDRRLVFFAVQALRNIQETLVGAAGTVRTITGGIGGPIISIPPQFSVGVPMHQVESLAALLPFLSDDDKVYRDAAKYYLDQMSIDTPELLFALLDALKAAGKNEVTRAAVLQMLETRLSFDKKIVPALRARFIVSHGEEQRVILGLFERLSGSATTALPQVIPLLAAADTALREAAESAAESIAANNAAAIKTLAKSINCDKPKIQQRVMRILNNLRALGAVIPELHTALKDKNPQVRLVAVNCLTQVGSAARTAIPDLMTILTTEQGEILPDTILAFERIGRASVPAILTELNQPTSPALDSLIELVTYFGAKASASVPALLRHLKTAKPDRAERIIAAIGAIGKDADAATSQIIALLKNADDAFAAQLFSALGKVSRDRKLVVNLMATRLDTASDALALSLTGELHALGVGAALAVPALLRAMEKRTDPDVVGNVIIVLGNIGVAARAAIPALSRRAFASKASSVAALRAIGRMGAAGIPTLRKALAGTSAHLRQAALEIIGEVGATALAARPELIAATKDKDSAIRLRAYLALTKIDGASPATFDIIIRGLRDANTNIRFNLAIRLGSMRKAAARAAPALSKNLRDKNAQIRQSAILALVKICTTLDENSDEMIELGFDLAQNAGWLAGDAPLTATRLQAELAHAEMDRRFMAILVVQVMAAPPKRLAAAVRGLLTDPNPPIAKAAALALKRLESAP